MKSRLYLLITSCLFTAGIALAGWGLDLLMQPASRPAMKRRAAAHGITDTLAIVQGDTIFVWDNDSLSR